jgi:hypothetical protein
MYDLYLKDVNGEETCFKSDEVTGIFIDSKNDIHEIGSASITGLASEKYKITTKISKELYFPITGENAIQIVQFILSNLDMRPKQKLVGL